MRRTLALAFSLALGLPAGGRAHDEPQWNWDDEDAQGVESAPPSVPEDPGPPPGGVDVQVGISTPGAAVSFDTFQGALAPHGEWVTVSNYGRVWRPGNVPTGWRPYYYGRWEWTDEGWLWVSDEPFGWATYHYGRWASDPYYGWVWVPGYQWAPAWVSWRYSPDYIGWAPLAPGFSVYVSSFPVAHAWWTFVPCNTFVGFPVYRHAYAPHYVPRLWGATRPAPPRASIYGHAAPAWGGPARPVVESRVGRPIVPVRVHPVGTPAAAAAPGRGGVFPVFRPEAARPGAHGSRPAWTGSSGARPAPQAERGAFGQRPAASPGWRGNEEQRPGSRPQAQPWGPQSGFRPQAQPQQGGRPQYAPPAQQGRSQYSAPPARQGRPQYAPPAQQGRSPYAAPPAQGRPQYAPPAQQGRSQYSAPPAQGRPQYAPPPAQRGRGGSAPAPRPAPSGGGQGGSHGGGQGGGHGGGQGGGRAHPR